MNGIFAISAALAAMEAQALKALASSSNPLATKLTTGKALTLSPLYSGVVAVNGFGGTYAMFTLGMKVGKVGTHTSIMPVLLQPTRCTHAPVTVRFVTR